jgi:dolichyl-phosphate-mannose--protein O-mannosyl transferase
MDTPRVTPGQVIRAGPITESGSVVANGPWRNAAFGRLYRRMISWQIAGRRPELLFAGDDVRALEAPPSRERQAGWLAPLLLVTISLVLHFVWYSKPMCVVFDEVGYGNLVMSHLKRQFMVDIHPPLGRLLLWAVAWVAHLDPGFSFATIGLPFPDSSYLVLRLLPRLAGTLLPVLIYALATELGMTRRTALVVGLLVALDNGLLVVSRFGLTDAFLLVFGFASLWTYLRAERSSSWVWLIASAVAAGCALSIKWTGLAFPMIIAVLQLSKLLADISLRSLARALIICTLPGVVYVSAFAAEFAVADRSGRDDKLMSPAFQATLAGNPYAAQPGQRRLGLMGKFLQMNAVMYRMDAAGYPEHSYYSKWYTWPLMLRSVYYWADIQGPKAWAVYFLGNPAVWWTSTCAMLILLLTLPRKIPALVLLAQPPPAERPELIVALGYLANLLPFIVVRRGMFLYHYLPALVFAILALGLLLDRVGRKHTVRGIVLIAAVGAFVWFAPLTYGLPIDRQTIGRIFWLHSWL